jgi:hypothetical protein
VNTAGIVTIGLEHASLDVPWNNPKLPQVMAAKHTDAIMMKNTG